MENAGSPPLRHWGLVGTVLWGVVVAAVFVFLQGLVWLLASVRGQPNLTAEELQAVLHAAQTNGTAFSQSYLVATVVCVALLLGIVKVKHGSSIREYLALVPAPKKTIGIWLGVLAVFVTLSDGLTLLLGRPVVPEVLIEIYSTTQPIWLIWVVLVVAAPLFEEALFRGFLYKGLSSSLLKPAGAIVITAGLWASIHVQYDAYGIITIFLLGLVVGAARWRTGSLFVPMTLHGVANAIAGLEVLLLQRS